MIHNDATDRATNARERKDARRRGAQDRNAQRGVDDPEVARPFDTVVV
jgi:hypothetical protein